MEILVKVPRSDLSVSLFAVVFAAIEHSSAPATAQALILLNKFAGPGREAAARKGLLRFKGEQYPDIL